MLRLSAECFSGFEARFVDLQVKVIKLLFNCLNNI